jgi:hypothetical protein
MTTDHLGNYQAGPEFPAKPAEREIGISGQRGEDKGGIEAQAGNLEHAFIADIFLQTGYLESVKTCLNGFKPLF